MLNHVKKPVFKKPFMFSPEEIFAVSIPIGIESGELPDSAIASSTDYDANHQARNGRLNFVPPRQGVAGAWCAAANDENQWIEFDLGALQVVTAICTQGRADHDQWVRSYILQGSRDGLNYEDYGSRRLFDGNSDRETVVRHLLDPVLICRYVRVLPKSWNAHISMRVGILVMNPDHFAHRLLLSRQSADDVIVVGELFSDDRAMRKGREFILENLDFLHDVVLRIVPEGWEETEGEVSEGIPRIRTFRSLLPESLEKGSVVNVEISSRNPGQEVLSEELFNEFLLSGLPAECSELALQTPEILVELYDVLGVLEMRELQLGMCLMCQTGEWDLGASFSVFCTCFERFEVCFEDDIDIKFSSPLTQALFNSIWVHKAAIQAKNEEGARIRKWLRARCLLYHLVTMEERADVASHPEFVLRNVSFAVSSLHLLLEKASSVKITDTLLKGTFSPKDSPPIPATMVILLIAYDCFSMILGFRGTERDEFQKSRTLLLDGMSDGAIRALLEFTYEGRIAFSYDDMSVSDYELSDILHLYHFAKQYDLPGSSRATSLLHSSVQALLHPHMLKPDFIDALAQVGKLRDSPSSALAVRVARLEDENLGLRETLERVENANAELLGIVEDLSQRVAEMETKSG